MRDPRRQASRTVGVGPQQQLVEVMGVNYTTNRVMVRDRLGTEFEVDGSVRPKGMGMPDPGERWIIARHGASWSLAMQIAAHGISDITGSRVGLHPVVVQLLDTLEAQGMIRDFTTGTAGSGLGDIPIPPADPTDPYTEPNSDPPVGDPTPTDPPPTDPDPITHHGGKKGSKDDTPVVGQKWIPLYIATYNAHITTPPQVAYADVLKLAATRANIVGFQEQTPGSRSFIFANMEAKGWGHYRPPGNGQEQGLTIMWRKEDFALLDSFDININERTGTLAGRNINIVKLLHKPSQRNVHFIDCHLHPHIETNGGPRLPGMPNTHSSPSLQATRLEQTYHYIEVVREQLVRFGDAPCYMTGDFNMDWFAVAQRRYPKYPAVMWTGVGGQPNWAALGRLSVGTRKAAGSYGNRCIDQVWMVNGKKNGTKFVDQWVLSGYHSDHRPVLVKTAIRGNDQQRKP